VGERSVADESSDHIKSDSRLIERKNVSGVANHDELQVVGLLHITSHLRIIVVHSPDFLGGFREIGGSGPVRHLEIILSQYRGHDNVQLSVVQQNRVAGVEDVFEQRTITFAEILTHVIFDQRSVVKGQIADTDQISSAWQIQEVGIVIVGRLTGEQEVEVIAQSGELCEQGLLTHITVQQQVDRVESIQPLSCLVKKTHEQLWLRTNVMHLDSCGDTSGAQLTLVNLTDCQVLNGCHVVMLVRIYQRDLIQQIGYIHLIGGIGEAVADRDTSERKVLFVFVNVVDDLACKCRHVFASVGFSC
jgi:hypothetical protein